MLAQIIILSKTFNHKDGERKTLHDKTKFKKHHFINPALQKVLEKKMYNWKRLITPKKIQGIILDQQFVRKGKHKTHQTHTQENQQTLLIDNSQHQW